MTTDKREAEIAERVEKLEKWAHEPFDFTHLIKRIERLEQQADQLATLRQSLSAAEATIAAQADLAEKRRDEIEAAEARDRNARQATVAQWCAAAFGEGQASSIEQRGIRLLEEAIEVYQACGAPAEMAHKMVDYIFARPAGTIEQELGGVGVTMLALANAAGVSADQCEANEVARVLAKPLAHFAARNQAKNDAGFRAARASD